ncbi:DUF3352 domain-containing protein [Saccharicrinis sp. GN24d3]|uniref:DUF3352 domain-containing protein n=1 Tax=Saccharicrinis sp. GN24d3 TaxID=3458416 RepID=UPI00403737BB
MKQFFKFIGILILAMVLVVLGVLAYLHFGSSAHRSPLSIIPDDAVLIAETGNISGLMVEVTNSDYWNTIIKGELFQEFKEGLQSFNTAIEENTLLTKVLNHQKVSVSMHQLSAYKSDFMVVMDVKKYGNLIPRIASVLKMPVQINVVDSLNLYSIVVEDLQETVHVAAIDNLLIGSLSYQLVEKTIKGRFDSPLDNSIKKNPITPVFEKRQLNVYADIGKVMGMFAKGADNSYLRGIDFSVLGGDVAQSSLILDGFTCYDDSIASLFNTLASAGTGARKADKVIPSGAVFYTNFKVNDFTSFYDDFLLQYSDLDPNGYSSYMSGVKLTESFLGIDLKEDVFAWMDGEIAMAKLRPSNNARELDFVIALGSDDVEQAQEKLDDISKRIKHRTAVRFKQKEYRNHNINYLNVSGFFRMILGDFFRNREKPYYTIVDDYVVFSNSSDRLMELIDSYLVGNTLHRNSSFAKFNEQLEVYSCLTGYVNMHRLYEHLYYYSNKEERQELKKYKELMQNIGLVGMQMFPENKLMRTQLIAKQDTSEKFNLALEQLNLSAEELVLEEFDSLQFKIGLGEEFADYNGHLSYFITHPERVQDSILMYEGQLDEGILDGIWKTYYMSGNIKSAVNYNDGLVDGTAIFYYNNDKHIIRAEIQLDDDIMDGTYKEFYADGNIKASLEFRDGQRWGDAVYYYQNGAVKINGHFRKNSRTGSWKFYSRTGELLKKENW